MQIWKYINTSMLEEYVMQILTKMSKQKIFVQYYIVTRYFKISLKFPLMGFLKSGIHQESMRCGKLFYELKIGNF